MTRRAERLDDEIQHHLDLLTAEYEARGMSPDEARLAARRAFGNVQAMKERHRDWRGFRWLDDLARDARYGVRMLLKDRWVTLTAAIALALGIAPATTVFTIVSTVLYPDLPFAEPERTVEIGDVSYPDLQDWRREARSFDGLAVASEATMNLADDTGTPERLTGAFLSANAFDLIGERPILGRSFIPADEREDAPPVVVLGQRIWRERYGADPAVIGRTIRINGVPSTVVGVMRAGFGFPLRSRLWQPASHLPETVRRDRAETLRGFGRLAPGASIDGAAAELRGIAKILAGRYPGTDRGVEPRVLPFGETWGVGGRARDATPVLAAVVVAVLLIAIANVANLLLARAAQRAREMSVRLAIGASRIRVVRQMLVESVLLAIVGGLAGLWLSLAGVRSFWTTLASGDVPPPYWLGYSIDWRVFAFFATLCLAAGIAFGVVPALQASRTRIAGVLNATSAGAAARSRWTNRFVIAQLALTPMLLCAAGLLVRSIAAQQDIDPGVPTAGIVRTRFQLAGVRYETRDARAQFYGRLQEQLDRSGLQATIASQAPFEGGAQRRLVDATVSDPRQYRVVRTVTVGARYFETLRTRVVSGRGFRASEVVAGQTPVIVNERFVALHGGGANPLGGPVTLTVGNPANGNTETFTVVGVAPNVRQRSTEAGGSFEPTIYIPYQGNPLAGATVLVRSDAPPASVAAALREQLDQIDPDIALYDVTTLDESLARSDERLGLRVFATLVSAMAAVGLFLAAVGVYAVTAYATAQRTREIGLRIALGAMSAQVWWLVTQRAAKQLLVGLSIGLLGALAVGQLLRGVLIGTSAADPATFAGVILVLAAATLLASVIPSRRAMRLDPVAALRTE